MQQCTNVTCTLTELHELLLLVLDFSHTVFIPPSTGLFSVTQNLYFNRTIEYSYSISTVSPYRLRYGYLKIIILTNTFDKICKNTTQTGK